MRRGVTHGQFDRWLDTRHLHYQQTMRGKEEESTHMLDISTGGGGKRQIGGLLHAVKREAEIERDVGRKDIRALVLCLGRSPHGLLSAISTKMTIAMPTSQTRRRSHAPCTQQSLRTPSLSIFHTVDSFHRLPPSQSHSVRI